MSRSGFHKIFYVLEGPAAFYSHTAISYDALMTAVLRLQVEHGILVHQSNNMNETVMHLVAMTRTLQTMLDQNGLQSVALLEPTTGAEIVLRCECEW